MTIPIYKPTLSTKSITCALQTGWISSQGQYVPMVEEKLKQILGMKHVLLLANGTCATHCLFIALKWKYPTLTKIYVPDNVYIAAYNAALMEYPLEALEVLPIDPGTLNMECNVVASLEQNSAVLVVHNLGHVVNVPLLQRERPDLIFLEDNCEGFLGTYEDRPSGSASLCSSLSFFANKTITCGEGGAFCTNDDEIAEFIFRTTHQGQTDTRYLHDRLGYNYRITNLQAALLNDQLDSLEEIIRRKRRVFNWYASQIGDVYQPAEGCTNANWMVCTRIPLPHPTFDGVETRPFFYHVRDHTHLKTIKLHPSHSVEMSRILHDECVLLPSYPDLTYQQVMHICAHFVGSSCVVS
jgi:perosamine synthetase